MSQRHLATYLNDHLAGAEVALELLRHLEATHGGTPVARFVAELSAEITADRREAEALMERLQISRSRLRTAGGWVAEKFTDLKLRLDDAAGGALRLLEVMEAVSVGIEGKRLLWRSLAAAAEVRPDLRGPDYGRLVERAEEQRRAVEVVRIEAAKVALAGAARPVEVRS